MARYYCEYCHSYLTHDTLSVRKSHLIGKNHLRIVGDYYRNKARQAHPCHEKRCNKGQRKVAKQTHAKLPIRCAANREKKRVNRIARYHEKELEKGESLLQKVYDGSPGFSKVFIDGNRLDIGDLVRTSRLPQRANASEPHAVTPARTRNELFHTSSPSFTLEPPRILTQWQTTVPKNSLYHDERLLNVVINESKRRMQAPAQSHTKRRKN